MKTRPISVVMPVYNSELYLTDAIESILNQSYTDFEFIIINDGSTDKSLEIIQHYCKKDGRIRMFTQPNRGLVAALNRGIKLAKGEYIARMDSDDISLPQRFEKQIEYMKNHPKCEVLGTQAELMDSEGNILDRVVSKPVFPIDIYLLLGHGSILAHPTILMKRSTAVSVGYYRESALQAEDFDMWQRIATRSNMANLSSIQLSYRQNPESISNTQGKKQGAKSLIMAREWRKGFWWKLWATSPLLALVLVIHTRKIKHTVPQYSIKYYVSDLYRECIEDFSASTKVLRYIILLNLRLSRKLLVQL